MSKQPLLPALMSQDFSPVDSSADEHASHQLSLDEPQFSANLFAGPCFGDASPSESSPATLVDAPSPSPLLLNSLANSNSQVVTIQSTPSQQNEDFIDLNVIEEIADAMSSSCSDRPDLTHESILEPHASNLTSLLTSSPADQPHAKSHTPGAVFSPLLSPPPETISNSAGHGSALPLNDFLDISSTSISLDEPTSVLEPLGPSSPEPDRCPENQSFEETYTSSANETDMRDPISEKSSLLDESCLPETLTESFLMEFTSDDNEILDTSVLPSSSPIDEPVSSPTSSSRFLALTFERPSSHSPNVHDPVPSSIEIPVVLLQSTDISSSPPTSSPDRVFTSSPPTASDSSVSFGDPQKPDLNTHALVDSTIFIPPSSSPQQHSSPLMTPAENSPLWNEDNLNEPPPLSSPFPSSSPSQQFMELTEEPPLLELDEVEVNIGLHSHPESVELAGVNPLGILSTTKEVPVQSSSVVLPPNPTPPRTEDRKTILSKPVDMAADSSDEAQRLSHKRKREEEGPQQEGEMYEITAQPPNPKRPTLASLKLQRKILVKPFRSPAMKPKAPEPVVAAPAPKKDAAPVILSSSDVDFNKKHRTQRAAGQFKSPLPLSVSSSIPASVRQTPTIQTLERKVQVLKRAVKIKSQGEEEALEALVKKWTEAGREVAWEVWGLIKDSQSGGGDDWGKDSQEAGSGKRRFEDSWGWNEESDSKRVKVEERNWGWDVSPDKGDNEHSNAEPVESIEEDKPQETLGTMLARLGIAPTTLGWNEEEGEFVDE